MKHNDILLSGGISTTISRMIPLTNDYVPVVTDILCGRRGNFNGKHRGNQIFAERVRGNICEYTNGSSRRKRTLVVAKIVDSLQYDGMRFIKFDSTVKKYVELSNEQVHSKVGHAIRDQIKNRSNGISAYQRPQIPRKQSRTSSLPTPHSLPSVLANVDSISTLTPKKKLPQRRHSDTAVHYNGEIDLIPPLVMNSQQQCNAAKEMSLQHDPESKIATNEEDITFLRTQQHVSRSLLLSRLIFHPGHREDVFEEIESNDFAVHAIEQVLSCFLPPAFDGQQENEYDENPCCQKVVDGPDVSKLPSSLDDFPPFFPVPLDPETNF